MISAVITPPLGMPSTAMPVAPSLLLSSSEVLPKTLSLSFNASANRFAAELLSLNLK
jgi:hypothetical protein